MSGIEMASIDEIREKYPEAVERARTIYAVVTAVQQAIIKYEMSDGEVMGIISSLGMTACEGIPTMTPARIADSIQKMIDLKTFLRSKPEGTIQ